MITTQEMKEEEKIAVSIRRTILAIGSVCSYLFEAWWEELMNDDDNDELWWMMMMMLNNDDDVVNMVAYVSLFSVRNLVTDGVTASLLDERWVQI